MDQAISRQVRYRAGVGLFTVVLAVQLVMVPVRQAQAAFPVIAAAAMFLKTPFGKSLAASLAIHASVLSLELYDSVSASTPPSDESAKRLDVKLSPSAPMATPAGWTPPVAPSVEPTAPATASQSSSSGWHTSNYTMASATAAADAQCKLEHGPTSTFTVPFFQCSTNGVSQPNVNDPTGTGYTSCGYGCTGSGYGIVKQIQLVSVPGCPAGYTVSGASCIKTDEAVIVKPPKAFAEIKRVANSFQQDARSADGLPPNTVVTPTDVDFTDSFGNKWNMHINADGTSTVTETRARTDGSGKTDEITVALTAPASGTGQTDVAGVAAKSYTGTGTLKSPTADAGGGDAKDSTLQAIKASIDSGNTAAAAERTAAQTAGAAVAGDLAGRAAAGQDTVAGLGLPGQGQYAAHDVGGIAGALPSSGSGGCVSLQVTLPYLGAMTIAPCAVVTAVSPLVNFLVVALGVGGGIFQILGRREET